MGVVQEASSSSQVPQNDSRTTAADGYFHELYEDPKDIVEEIFRYELPGKLVDLFPEEVMPSLGIELEMVVLLNEDLAAKSRNTLTHGIPRYLALKLMNMGTLTHPVYTESMSTGETRLPRDDLRLKSWIISSLMQYRMLIDSIRRIAFALGDVLHNVIRVTVI